MDFTKKSKVKFWVLIMNLYEMKNYLIKRFEETGYVPGFPSGVHKMTFMPDTVHKANIGIFYPGYKNTSGVKSYDYCVKFHASKYDSQFEPVTHEKIMENFAAVVYNNPSLTNLAIDLLCDISHSWENVQIEKYNELEFPDFTVGELIECICYIAVQEEINYPQEKNFLGYKRPFYSYLESIYASNGSGIIDFAVAIKRCNSNRRFVGLSNINYSII